MKLDLSTVFLVVLCVIPGLFALRARNMVCPRSFEEQGTTAELGELVALGITTHGILVCLVVCGLWCAGLCAHFTPNRYITLADRLYVTAWTTSHKVETLFLATLYVFASFAISHWLGIIYGSRRLQNPITAKVLLSRNSYISRKLGITGLLGERPIIYEALSPPAEEADGPPFLVFVEIELKSSAGFYTGQVSQFSILRDAEPHKPIYLIEASFKLNRTDDYESVDADGILLDLADAAVIRVTQIAQDEQELSSLLT